MGGGVFGSFVILVFRDGGFVGGVFFRCFGFSR